MKIFVVVREGWWWPDRSNPATLAPFTKIAAARTTYDAARRAMENLVDEPEWFVGETEIDGKITLCVLVDGIDQVELTD